MTKIDGDVQELTRLKVDHDPRIIAEMKAEDPYEEGTITEATLSADNKRWGLVWESGSGGSRGCGCPARSDHMEVIPGATIRIYSSGLGSFHGIDIDGVEFFWRTPWERLAERIKWLADYDRRQREEFAAKKDKLDATYQALSGPMKLRIDGFRAAEADFRIKGEAYEIFACSQADAFAQRAKQAAMRAEDRDEVDAWFENGGFERETPGQLKEDAHAAAVKESHEARWLLWWSRQPYERQKELMPAMDDGHSGNTYGAAWFFGVRLLLNRASLTHPKGAPHHAIQPLKHPLGPPRLVASAAWWSETRATFSPRSMEWSQRRHLPRLESRAPSVGLGVRPYRERRPCPMTHARRSSQRSICWSAS